MATRLIIFVLIALFWATIFMMMCGCSPQKRLNRLVRKHPELIDTAKKTIITPIIVVKKIDQHKLDSLNKRYKSSLDSAKANVDTIIQKEPCAELGKKIKSKLNNLNKNKEQIDTVYRDAKCEISPFTIDTLGMLIKVSYNQDKVYLDIKAKQAVITNCEEKQFYEFWQFWVAVLLFLLAVYLKR